MRRNLLVLVVVLAFGPFFSAYSQSLSLDEALSRVEESPRIGASRENASTFEAEADMARGMFYPNVQITHGYGFTNNPVGVFSAKLQQRRFTQADFAINSLNNPDPVHHWHTRFQLMQPILNSWVDIKNKKAAEKMAESGQAEHEFHISQMKLQVEILYWTIAAFEEVNVLYDNGIGRLKDLEKSYQLMEAPTSATTTNFLITQSVRLDLEARRNGIQSGIENGKNSLAKLLDLPAQDRLTLTDNLPRVETQLDLNLDEGTRRADLVAMQRKAEAASAAASAKEGTWLPRLDFVAGYNLYTGDYSFVETAYDLGVQLTWDVFQGPRIGQIRKATRERAAAKKMQRALALDIEAEQENSKRDLESRIAEYRLIREAKNRAEEALGIAKKRYAQGTLPLFDYSQAIQNWVQVREALVLAQKSVVEANALARFQEGTK